MVTPPDEIDRINDRLFNESKFQIQDRDSYDLAYSDLLSTDEDELTGKQLTLRNQGFNDYVSAHPEVSEERLFKKAKGKDLRRDRLKTAKKVVTTRKEYIEGRASRLDLKGYDTARQRVTKDIKIKRTFTIKSFVKRNVVFSKRTSVVVRGKRVARWRTPSGKFASIIMPSRLPKRKR